MKRKREEELSAPCPFFLLKLSQKRKEIITSVDLDPISSSTDLSADDLHNLVHAVGDLSSNDSSLLLKAGVVPSWIRSELG